MSMPSVMTHSFSRAPQADIPRSQFNRSHGYKTTFDAGYLVPVFLDEALPGDTFNCRMTAFARLATPIVPIMDNMFLDSFFFAVPVRLVWDNWQKFNGEQDNPEDSTDYLVPTMESPATVGYANGSLSDYFGIPTGVPGLSHSSLWHRAYNLIWNQWFRDQNLQDSVVVDKDDGPDDPANYVLLRRGKRHDYFTSCLPWPFKGPNVELPLLGTAPVYGQAQAQGAFKSHIFQGVSLTNPNPVVYGSLQKAATTTGSINAGGFGTDTWDANAARGISLGTKDQYTALSGAGTYAPPYADLSGVTAATINELRQAFQIQKLYERDARGGTRYTEIILSHFHVRSDDARLQRPEYLGGGSTPVNINPVAQTSATTEASPLANLAAFGTVSAHGHGFTKSFTEHCLIIGMVNVRADLTYQQGLNRMFSRQTRWDFYWPALSHIGEQAVLNKEIYADGTAADENVFGYQERYAEYRYKPSLITGQFRSNFAQSLDVWHLSQDFETLPQLNEEFIVDNPPLDRVLATADMYPHFLFDSFFSLKCARPMPVYSVPGLIDHF